MFVLRCMRFAVVSPKFVGEITRKAFDFYFETFATDDHSYLPWFELDDSLTSKDSEVASVVLRELLEEVLDETGSARKSGVISLLLLGGIRVANITADGRTPGVLDSTIAAVAQNRISDLKQVAASEPWVWNSLAIGGLHPPRDAIKEMKAAGFSFADIYFNHSPRDDYIPSTPIADQMMRQAMSAGGNFSKRLRGMMSEYSEQMVEDFIAVEDRGTLGFPRPVMIGPGFVRQISRADGFSSLDRSVRDAFALGLIGAFTIDPRVIYGLNINANEPNSAGSRAELGTVLTRLNLSPAIELFVTSWVAEEAELFAVEMVPS